MARETPRVDGATLVNRTDAAQAILVGTPAWYAWLDRATSFAFVDASGRFTARKERRQGTDRYWKAYRKRAGVVRSAYLGKTPDLTLERLQAAAVALAEPTPPSGAAPGPDRDLAAGIREPTAGAPTSLPTGTVTFLFTDIEGSTQLWEQHPQVMPVALARHDAILHALITAHHGVVFKTVGDSAHAVFATAPDALAAALACQRALHAEPWGPTGPLPVRMALHTGVAELCDGDYYGAPLNRVARILATGQGGQILLSLATEELVRDQLPPGTTLDDLGLHQLIGLRLPERIFQLSSTDLPTTFPPLRVSGPGPPQPAAVVLPLLTTKLAIPPARASLVPRPHLAARHCLRAERRAWTGRWPRPARLPVSYGQVQRAS
jgi:class 3 adenylate cyclase